MVKDISNFTSSDERGENSHLIEEASSQEAQQSPPLSQARELAYSRPHSANDSDSEDSEQQRTKSYDNKPREHDSGNTTFDAQGRSPVENSLPRLHISDGAENGDRQTNLPSISSGPARRYSSVAEFRERAEQQSTSEKHISSMLEQLHKITSKPERAGTDQIELDAGIASFDRMAPKESINGATTVTISTPAYMLAGRMRLPEVEKPGKDPKQEDSPTDSFDSTASKEQRPEPHKDKDNRFYTILPLKKPESTNSNSPATAEKPPSPSEKPPSPTEKTPSDGNHNSGEKPKPGIGSLIDKLLSNCPTGCADDKGKQPKPNRNDSGSPEIPANLLPSIIGGRKEKPINNEGSTPSKHPGGGDRSIPAVIPSPQPRPDDKLSTQIGSGLSNVIGAAISTPPNQDNRRSGTDISIGNMNGGITNPQRSLDNTSSLPAVSQQRAETRQENLGNQLQLLINRQEVLETPKPTSFRDSILPMLQDLFNNTRVQQNEQVADRNASTDQRVILEPRQSDRSPERVTKNFASPELESAQRQIENRGQSDNRSQSDARGAQGTVESQRVADRQVDSNPARNLRDQGALSSHIVSAGTSFNRATIDAVHIAPRQIDGVKQATERQLAGPVKLADLNLKSNPDSQKSAADMIKHGDILKQAGLPSGHNALFDADYHKGLKVPPSELGNQALIDHKNGRLDANLSPNPRGIREPNSNGLNGLVDRLLGPGGKQLESQPIPLTNEHAEKGGTRSAKSGPSHKDVADKKDDLNSEKTTIIVVGSKKRREEKPNETKRTDRKNNTDPEVRKKYAVRPGDTLQSIARIHLFDERFALLLEMINRGNLHYKYEGSIRKVVLRVGQSIWLPTTAEMKVHRTLFFTEKNSKQLSAEPETSLLSTPRESDDSDNAFAAARTDLRSAIANNTFEKSEESLALRVEQKFEQYSSFLEDLTELPKPKRIRRVTRKSQSQQSIESSSQKLEGTKNLYSVLHAIRHTGQRAQIAQDLPELLIIDSSKQEFEINSGVENPTTAENIRMEANNSFDMLSRIFEQQNIATQKPSVEPAANISDMLKKMRECAAANNTGRNEHIVADRDPQVDTFTDLTQKESHGQLVQINESIRITTKESSTDRASFVISLEACLDNCWTTIASYESNRGRTARFLFRRHGGRQEFTLQLPQFVVRNMALQDFTRNHHSYVAEFIGQCKERRNSLT